MSMDPLSSHIFPLYNKSPLSSLKETKSLSETSLLPSIVESKFDYANQAIKATPLKEESIPTEGEKCVEQADKQPLKETSHKKFILKHKDKFLNTFHTTRALAYATLKNVAKSLPKLNISLVVIQGVDIALAIPTSVLRVHSLAKSWKTTSHAEKTFDMGNLLHVQVNTAAAVTSFIQSISPVSTSIKSGALKASLFLGPAATGLGSVLAAVKGTVSAIQAKNWAVKKNAAENLTNKYPNGILHSLFQREVLRFSANRTFAGLASFQSYFLSAGLATHTVVTALIGAGVIGAVAVTAGWALVGIAAATALIGVGIFAYRLYQSKSKERQEQAGLAKELKVQISSFTQEKINSLYSKKNQFNPSHPSQVEELVQFIQQVGWEQRDEKKLSVNLSEVLKQIKKWGLKLNAEEESLLKIAIQDRDPTIGSSFLQKIIRTEIKNQGDKAIQKWTKIQNTLIKKKIERLVSQEIQQLLMGHLKTISLEDENFQRMVGTPISDQNLAEYIKQMINSPIWPGNPSLTAFLVKSITKKMS